MAFLADIVFILDEGKITSLSVSSWGFGTASVVSANDRTLDLEQAADKFATLSAQPSLLVARINEANQCEPLVVRDAEVLRSVASVFKIWILAGVADAFEDESLFHDQITQLDEAKQVNGGSLNYRVCGH